ncbi:hypothetical protein HC256_007466 [Beauveria bassiana]|nr:hypothetical protein HC256_007466 [Beauveria bassiana]
MSSTAATEILKWTNVSKWLFAISHAGSEHSRSHAPGSGKTFGKLSGSQQLIVHLSPNPEPSIRILRMRHIPRLPDAVKVAPAALAALFPDALRTRIRPAVDARGRVDDAVRALLGANGKQVRKELQHKTNNDADPAEEAVAALEGPDAAVDVARVHAVDGDVAVLFRLQQPRVHLGQPALKVELVVIIHLHALAARAVEVVEVVDANVRHARGGADDARRLGARQRRQQPQRQQHVRQEIDLVHELEAVLAARVLGEAARVGAHAGIVAENVERAARVQPAPRKRVDALQPAHVNLPPLDAALVVAGRPRDRLAVVRDRTRVLLGRADAAGKHQVGAALGKVQRRLLADAAVGARDDDPAAAQVLGRNVLLGERLAGGALPEALVAAPEPGRLRKGERCVVGDVLVR